MQMRCPRHGSKVSLLTSTVCSLAPLSKICPGIDNKFVHSRLDSAISEDRKMKLELRSMYFVVSKSRPLLFTFDET